VDNPDRDRFGALSLVAVVLAGGCATTSTGTPPSAEAPAAEAPAVEAPVAEAPAERAIRYRFLEGEKVVATVDRDGRVTVGGTEVGRLVGEDTLVADADTTWRLGAGTSPYAREHGAWQIFVNEGGHAVLVAERGGFVADGLDVGLAEDGTLSGPDLIGVSSYRIEADPMPAERRLASMVLLYLIQEHLRSAEGM
jgi:hypothetical protein